MNVDEQSYREKVYEIVREIPSGKVMTYGQIAEMLGRRLYGANRRLCDARRRHGKRPVAESHQFAREMLDRQTFASAQYSAKNTRRRRHCFQRKGKMRSRKIPLVSRRFRAGRRRTAEFVRLRCYIIAVRCKEYADN